MTHKALIRKLQISCLGLDPIDPLRLLVDDVIAALAQTEQEPVMSEDFIKWDEDIDPIGEVVGFIEGSPYIMVKVHKGTQVSLDDDLYATPPQRTWVDLTDEEENEYNYLGPDMHWVIQEIAAKLKERNA
jgi:hypothetical protein